MKALRGLCFFVSATAVAALAPVRAALPIPPLKQTVDHAAPETASLDAEVERHKTLGQRLLGRGRTQEAIAELRRGYELRADPEFLYYLGEGYRQLGLRDQALFFYRRYLSAAPEAPDRDDVEERIAGLQVEARVSALPPPAPPGNLAHDVVIVPVDHTDRTATARPLWRRWWVWTTLGALVAASTALAFVLGRTGTEVPPTALGDKRFY